MASTIGNFCDMLALIRKQPRSADDIVEVTGIRRPTVKRFIDHMSAEGHIRIDHWRPAPKYGKPAPIYAWQTTVFEKPNAVYARKR